MCVSTLTYGWLSRGEILSNYRAKLPGDLYKASCIIVVKVGETLAKSAGGLGVCVCVELNCLTWHMFENLLKNKHRVLNISPFTNFSQIEHYICVYN